MLDVLSGVGTRQLGERQASSYLFGLEYMKTRYLPYLPLKNLKLAGQPIEFWAKLLSSSSSQVEKPLRAWGAVM